MQERPRLSAIPKLIWQTYRCSTLPAPATRAASSWRSRNPSWTYRFESDDGIDEFFEAECSRDLARTVRGMPLGVMKADIWRYAVLYRYGGIYADIDTQCKVPLGLWTAGDGAALDQGQGVWVALENDVHFCQWTIASEPEHPILRAVLDLIVERARPGLRRGYEHFVHYHTGPGVWTDAIRGVLGLHDMSPRDIYEKHRADAAAHDITLLSSDAFNGSLVRHDYGSRTYQDGYVRWIDERERMTL